MRASNLTQAFTALYGRVPDATDRADGLWNLCCAAVIPKHLEPPCRITLPLGESVKTVELVAKALYDSLERDNDAAVLGEWEFGEPITIDGRFNLTSVALRLMVELAVFGMQK